jgi:hypothetical protein
MNLSLAFMEMLKPDSPDAGVDHLAPVGFLFPTNLKSSPAFPHTTACISFLYLTSLPLVISFTRAVHEPTARAAHPKE